MDLGYLAHIGTPHEGTTPHSGRHPWGSGKNPKQHPRDMYERIQQMHRQGCTDKQIAEGLGLTLRELQATRSYAKDEHKLKFRTEALDLIAQGYSLNAAAKKLDIPERTLAGWLNDDFKKKALTTQATADMLEKEVMEHKYVDVGFGVAQNLGISTNKLAAAVQKLKDKGYVTLDTYIPQVGFENQNIAMKVLCPNGTTKKEIFDHQMEIVIPNQHISEETGNTWLGLKPIQSISSDRVSICYAEEGGSAKDGVIELRRGVDGLSMGSSRYAQVRIGVDDKYYLKGMAIYSDDLPDGVDIRFNTSKKIGTPMLDPDGNGVLKVMKMDDKGEIDKDNPFGSAIKKDGQKGYLNIVREEGDWTEWSKTLASQFLSKQSEPLARKQLDLALSYKKDEFEQIQNLTNPTLKKYLLDAFADSCDSDAEHLKAASLPRQANKVILPLNTIKPNQIYAPGFHNGEVVALVRYPHQGTFEIPVLTVNNHNKEAERLFGQAIDAVGINISVAQRLSGADFDGDTVTVIPNNDNKIVSTRPLKGLENFDPKEAYPERKGMKYMTEEYKQNQMGVVSNLVTDMTLQGAPEEELVMAVKHAQVIIDAKKHKLDYTRSSKENHILELKEKWQVKEDGKTGGAATLISRAKGEKRVPERRQFSGDRGIDPETGEKVYYETGRSGKKTKTTQMALAKDAKELINPTRGTKMEYTYAEHANSLKALANLARKEILSTKDIAYNPKAYSVYSDEVASLKEKVTDAIKTRPYERQAHIIANHIVNMKIEDNGNMTKKEISKARTMALKEQRARLNSKAKEVVITNREWEAIQSGAVSKSLALSVFRYANQEKLKELAMPKNKPKVSESRAATIKQMYARGYTQADIAQRFGISSSTVSKIVRE